MRPGQSRNLALLVGIAALFGGPSTRQMPRQPDNKPPKGWRISGRGRSRRFDFNAPGRPTPSWWSRGKFDADHARPAVVEGVQAKHRVADDGHHDSKRQPVGVRAWLHRTESIRAAR